MMSFDFMIKYYVVECHRIEHSGHICMPQTLHPLTVSLILSWYFLWAYHLMVASLPYVHLNDHSHFVKQWDQHTMVKSAIYAWMSTHQSVQRLIHACEKQCEINNICQLVVTTFTIITMNIIMNAFTWNSNVHSFFFFFYLPGRCFFVKQPSVHNGTIYHEPE